MKASADPTTVSSNRSVVLTCPAKAGYVILARLALSAVCRLTPLAPDDVADLKLAITEAAAYLVRGLADDLGDDDDELAPLGFTFQVEDDRLLVEITGPREADVNSPQDPSEQALRHAIIAATVDEWDHRDGMIRLVKYLKPSAR